MARRRSGTRCTSSSGGSIECAHQPSWIAARRSQHRVVVHGDEFAIASDQIADPGGLAALARPRNHNDRRVLERGGNQFGGKARKQRVIGIVDAG
jgi:hypothetical protein